MQDEEEVDPIKIPRGVFWICAVAPWFLAPVVLPQLLELDRTALLRTMAASYPPFLTTPALLCLVYDWLAPPLLRGKRRLSRFVLHLLISSATSLLASLITFPFCNWLGREPIPLSRHIVVGLIITWTFMLPTVLLQEQRGRAERIERRARAEREAALEAQLALLQSRTSPHFFFNSINTVASLIPDDPRRAEDTLLRLAEILRYALEGGRTRFVPLGRELDIVRDYLEVQSARFESKLRFCIDVGPGLREVAVPPLFLQPLVENAVLHGVSQRAGGGEVRVSVLCERDVARIEVLDDGVGPGRSEHHGNGTALIDLAARLHLLYGNEGQLESGPRLGGGYRVQVTLPARELAS